MKIKSSLQMIMFFLSLLLTKKSVAQYQYGCDIDSIMHYKGIWKKDNDANMKPGLNMVQVITRIDKLQKILQAATPEPRGIEAHWLRGMNGYSLIKDGPIPYQLEALYLICRCNVKTKKMVPEDETGTWFFMNVNSFSGFLKELDGFMIENNPIYILPKPTDELKGFFVYDVDEEYYSGSGGYSQTVIITRSGQQPYKPVTKKEFLKAYITHFEKEAAKSLYDENIKLAQNLLINTGEEEGEKPAIINMKSFENFKDFGTLNRGGSMLVRINPDYFKMKLKNYVPQFIVANWTWNDLKPTNFCEKEIEENIDFSAIQKMLDQ